MNVLFSLKNSAAGYDGIPGSIMKQCAQQYLAELTYIINCSILEGYFPDELKLAKVLSSNPMMKIKLKIIDQFLFFHSFQRYLRKLLLIML